MNTYANAVRLNLIALVLQVINVCTEEGLMTTWRGHHFQVMHMCITVTGNMFI